MNRFVSRAAMESVAPGVYSLLPEQFRDRMPDGVVASPQNSMIFRNGFGFLTNFVDETFARLRYREGEPWPMWKLVAAFYLVEARVGRNTVRHTGEQIYSTMPWPTQIRSVADALRFSQVAYFESHGRAPHAVAGGWRPETDVPGRMILADDTPYPCHLQEGVVAGICRAFARDNPVFKLLAPETAKRNGGTITRYEIVYAPR